MSNNTEDKISNIAYRNEIIERLGEIISWKSSEPVYIASFNDFFMDDLASDLYPESLVGYVILERELDLYKKFIDRWSEFRSQLGSHDIFRLNPLPADLDLQNLQHASRALLNCMIAKST